MKITRKNYLIALALICVMSLLQFGLVNLFGFNKCWGTARNTFYIIFVVVFWYTPIAALVKLYVSSNENNNLPNK